VRTKPDERRGKLSAGLAGAILSGLLCLNAARGHATEAYCEKKAESLGWAIGCGCLKHELARVQENIFMLLPECSKFRLERSVANGLKDSAGHDEYDFLCMMSCNSTDWGIVNKVIGQKVGSPI